MNSVFHLFSEPWAIRLGWVLVHFIWQGAAIFLCLGIFLRLGASASSHVRYLVIASALMLCGVAPVATWIALGREPVSAAVPSPAPVDQGKLGAHVSPAPVLHSPLPFASRAAPRAVAHSLSVDILIQAASPYLVMIWIAGIVMLSLRLSVGWVLVFRISRSGTLIHEPQVLAQFHSLLERMRIAPGVRLLRSTLVEVPTLIGWLRPVVLIPSSILTGLSRDHLEAILAHELSHVRRWDYLVNLIQTLLEIILFYHPAVWWISGKLREERENCCDDLAIEVTQDRLVYATALAQIEERRALGLTLTASGSLLHRIERIVGANRQKASSWPLLLGAIPVLLLAYLTITQAAPPETAAPDPAPAEAKRTTGVTTGASPSPAATPSRWDGQTPFVTQLPSAPGGFLLDVTRPISWTGRPAFPTRLAIKQGDSIVFEKDNVTASPATIHVTLKPGKYEMKSDVPKDSEYWSAHGGSFTIAEDGQTRVLPQEIKHWRKIRPIGPMNLQMVEEKRPALRWEPIDGADYYRISWFEKDPVTDKVIRRGRSENVEDTKWTFDSEVRPDRVYEWSVRAYETAGNSFAYYVSSYFKTGGIAPPPAESDAPAKKLQITGNTARLESNGSRVLGIDIRSLSKDPLEASRVEIIVHAYMQKADGTVALTTGRVVPQWTTAPINWKNGASEHLDITLPAPEAGSNDKFFGYYVGVSYQGSVQDIRVDPPSLVKEFSLPIADQ